MIEDWHVDENGTLESIYGDSRDAPQTRPVAAVAPPEQRDGPEHPQERGEA
jgi:hypothetical protein